MMQRSIAALAPELHRIITASHHDPFQVLGKHATTQGEIVRAFIPDARRVAIADTNAVMEPVDGTGLFQWQGNSGTIPDRYRLDLVKTNGHHERLYDPYCFPAQLTEFDLHLFGEGTHRHVGRFLGANPHTVDGVSGVLFATWAPTAERVSVVGDFNQWDGRRHPMRVRGGSGVWELFIPGTGPEEKYKFEIRNRHDGSIHVKTDPYARAYELRPKTAALVKAPSAYEWKDSAWMNKRQATDWQRTPLSIYEVHLGSWRRDANSQFLNYREAAKQLVEYVLEMGFTHIELLPVSEHPFDASWGYQSIGNFAPTSRYGSPDDFRFFVDLCHQHSIGVILDWVPGHFPKDAHGLARFDGSALYEHEDPRRGEHREWGTLIFNYARNEVRAYLISSAIYWMEEFHIDGLRVDAVASMLYLDYSRNPGDWIPNEYGGNENLDAIRFMRELNAATHELFPGSLMFAEESTAWPMVSRPAYIGGLGFSMKWNMGWMNDTLAYMSLDPVFRQYHHNNLTFSQLYAYTENFVLPFSHDEVVHGKKSLLYKMPGDEWQRFANLRLLLTYMYTHPGKKLLFMGCEFGQGTEWDSSVQLDWYVLQYKFHQGIQLLVKDLNRLYRQSPALYEVEFDHRGFQWIDCHDAPQSILSFIRRGLNDDFLVVVANFTPIPRQSYRLGVPQPGMYAEIFNSDSQYYGGGNVGNGEVRADKKSWMGQPYSIELTLPPLASIVLRALGGTSETPFIS